MPLRDTELDIANVLQAAGLGVSMASSPPSLYAGPFPAGAPDRMVACRHAGGDDSAEYLGGGSIFAPDVQVLVRGDRDRYRDTLTLAQSCFEALHLPAVSGYILVKAEGAGPSYLGPDDKGRHVFSFTVVCQYAT